MNYILFDGASRSNLLPLTYTKPVADIRIGILTIREKWEKRLATTTTTLTEEYLQDKYPMVEMVENVMINASFLPTNGLAEIIMNLKENQMVIKEDEIVAFFTKDTQEEVNFDTYDTITYESQLIKLNHTWDIFNYNGEASFSLKNETKDLVIATLIIPIHKK